MWIWHGGVGRHEPTRKSFHRLIWTIGDARKARHIGLRVPAGCLLDHMAANAKFASDLLTGSDIRDRRLGLVRLNAELRLLSGRDRRRGDEDYSYAQEPPELISCR